MSELQQEAVRMISGLSDDNISFLIEIIRRLMSQSEKTDMAAMPSPEENRGMQAFRRLDTAREEIRQYLPDDFDPVKELEEARAKNLVVLIDTNVVIDFLMTREPFYKASSDVIAQCAGGKLDGCMAFHSVPNLWYILRKVPEIKRRKWLSDLCEFLRIEGVSHEDVVKAIKMTEFKDFEDCLQDRCAERIKAEYIITRNTDDFEGSAVPAVAPEEFLEIILKS